MSNVADFTRHLPNCVLITIGRAIIVVQWSKRLARSISPDRMMIVMLNEEWTAVAIQRKYGSWM